jgi:hypothetical protein
MDKGAARSRKQAQRIQHQPEPSSRSHDADTSTTRDRPIRTSEPGPSRFRPKIIDNTDPSRFRPKAIRESAALVWAQQQFAIPPSPEALSKVTRVDLTGSDCTDISWLEGTKVTWLSLKGCKVQNGWDAVASLQELSGQSMTFLITATRTQLILQCSTSLIPVSNSSHLHGRPYAVLKLW